MNIQSQASLEAMNTYGLKVVEKDGAPSFELINHTGAAETHGTFHFSHIHMANYHVGGQVTIQRGNKVISESRVFADERWNIFPSAQWLSEEFAKAPCGRQEIHASDLLPDDVVTVSIPTEKDNWLACVVAYQDYCEHHGISAPKGVTYPSFEPVAIA